MAKAQRISPVLVLAAALTLAGCGTGPAGGSLTPAQNTQAPTPPDDQLDTNATVNVGLTLEPTSLDIFRTAGAALDQLLLDNVYQGLVSVDTNAKDKIVPALADSWDESADGLVYTFHLDPRARFHDGSPLTAADAAWSLRQEITPGSGALRAADFTAVADVSAPDPATVRITLTRRDTLLLWALSQRGGIVYKQGTDLAGLDDTENGSGPFRLTRWNRGSSITLDRVDSYWGVEPKVARVVLHYIKDPNTANNAEATGQTDIEAPADPTLLQPFADSARFTVLRGTTTDKFTLAFNDARAPFTNPNVRHAIRQAIDKKGAIAAFGSGIAIGSDVPPQDPWYEDLTAIDAYDPDNSRKLLAAAGFGQGLALELDVPNIYPAALTDLLVSDLKKVGITLTVRQLEFQAWLSKVYVGKDFQLSLVDHAEAGDLNHYIEPTYYFGYDNPQVQQWYAAALDAASDADRDALLKKVAQQISEDAASDWLLLVETTTVVRHGVYGVPQAETSNRFNLAALAVAK